MVFDQSQNPCKEATGRVQYLQSGKEAIMREVRPFEPWFFILFGLFHLHRVWGLLDRESYAAFWLGVLTERGVFYWTLMAALGGM